MSRFLIVTVLASSLSLAACATDPGSRQINFLREPPAKKAPQRKSITDVQMAKQQAGQKEKTPEKEAEKAPKK